MVLELINGFLNWLSTTGASLIAQFGLVGLLFTGILLNATIFFGIPMEIILVGFSLASKTNPLLIALVAGFGAAIGELTGYALGRAGTGITEKIEKHQITLFKKMREQIDSKGPIAVFLFLLVPLPFDLVGIACGVVKMNPLKFFLATFAGKTARYFIVIIAGTWGIKLLLQFFGLS